ncbi:MAG: DUF4258 domain-containing protein [Candidatus Levyibacteriota bacterium]
MTYIWTNHARDRLNERKISKQYIDQTLNNPDKIVENRNGTRELQKRIGDRTFAAIIKENERREQLIVSCWVNPAYPGTKDAKKHARYLKMQKASFWGKLWLTLLDQVGL